MANDGETSIYCAFLWQNKVDDNVVYVMTSQIISLVLSFPDVNPELAALVCVCSNVHKTWVISTVEQRRIQYIITKYNYTNL